MLYFRFYRAVTSRFPFCTCGGQRLRPSRLQHLWWERFQQLQKRFEKALLKCSNPKVELSKILVALCPCDSISDRLRLVLWSVEFSCESGSRMSLSGGTFQVSL